MPYQTIPVTGSKVPTRLVSAGDGSTLLVNSDLNNTIYLSDQDSFQIGDQNVVPLSPQSFLVVDGGDENTNAITSGPTVNVYAIPGGTSFFQSGIRGAGFFISGSGEFAYSTAQPSFNNLTYSVVPGNASINDGAGNIALPGETTYVASGHGYYIALQNYQGTLTLYTATNEAGPWTAQSSISLNDPNNVGGITIQGPSVRIASGNNSGLEIVNGVNSWPDELLMAHVAAEESVISSTTLTQDVYLSFSTLQPNAVYDVEGVFIYKSAVGVNFKYSFAIGGSSDQFFVGATFEFTTTGTPQDNRGRLWNSGNQGAGQTDSAATQGTTTNGGSRCVIIKGTYYTGAAGTSPGVFALMWAQGTSSATGLALLQGSKLKLRRIQ